MALSFQKSVHNLFTKARSLYTNFKEEIDYGLDFLRFTAIYGVMLSFAFSVLIPRFMFNIKSVIAWGLAFYFVKEELPSIIKEAFNRQRPII